jgi:imidazolonepropionase-like amidohydrolase
VSANPNANETEDDAANPDDANAAGGDGDGGGRGAEEAPGEDGDAEYDLLLRGDVWDAAAGRRADRWVAVADGRIAGVHDERPGAAAVEREATLVTPGLVDAHVHLVWDGSDDPVATLRAESLPETTLTAAANARRQLRGGVTTVRDLGSVADVAVHVAAAVREGRLAGPRTLAAGRTVTITAGHDPFWAVASDGPEACRRTVRELRGAGADVIKVSATGGVYGQAVGEDPGTAELSRAELEAVVEEAARFDLPVAAHAIGPEGVANAVAAGVDTVEHGNLAASPTVSTMAEADVAYVPTLYVYDEIATGGRAPAYARENAAGVVERHREVFAETREADVRILAGSDAGSPATPHPAVHRELEAMVAAGATPEAALTAATATPAAEFGRPGLGRVAAGTPADLVGFDADPLADVGATADPAWVVARGALVR